VQVTESGLQYRIIEQGSGSSPDANSQVRVNYTGKFTNGYVFDQSPPEGTQINLQGYISGFSEGIQLMQEGAIYELFVPADIGYGDNPPATIPQGAVLIFEVELLQNAG
jgi:FKBP-type peptidyl-prolyl cis-trans isomerase FkpA/FKBP-type peptidyl-prolyl cis-trans isomerase FklB